MPYILMHSRGDPKTMQNPENTTYRDICKEVGAELQASVEAAMTAGVPGWNIIVDPGEKLPRRRPWRRRLGLHSRLAFSWPSEAAGACKIAVCLPSSLLVG